MVGPKVHPPNAENIPQAIGYEEKYLHKPVLKLKNQKNQKL